MKKWFFVLLSAGILGAGGYYGWEYYQNSNEPVVAFKTAVLAVEPLTQNINATGVVEPEELINVGAQVNGLILSFGEDVNGKSIDYGSHIQEGTVLASIDSSLYEAELLQCKAQVAQARASIEKAYADSEQSRAVLKLKYNDYLRAARLVKSNVIGQAAYEEALSAAETAQANMRVCEAQIAQARASLASAEASLSRAVRNLGYCTIISPVKGVVIDRRVNIGQTVVSSMSASSLFLIAKDLSRMQVWASVNEADIGKITPGMAVIFTVDAFPEREFKGTVGKIRLNAALSSNVVIYTVEIQADNSDGTLLPYLTANVKFIVRHCDSEVVVPNSALRFIPSEEHIAETYAQWLDAEAKPGHGVVWRYEEGELAPVPVEILLTDGVKSAVRGEIASGMRVVTGIAEFQEAAGDASSNPFMPKFPKRDKKKSNNPPPR